MKKVKKLINEGSIPYIMPYLRSIDIDERFQLQLIKKNNMKKKINVALSYEVGDLFLNEIKKRKLNKKFNFKLIKKNLSNFKKFTN